MGGDDESGADPERPTSDGFERGVHMFFSMNENAYKVYFFDAYVFQVHTKKVSFIIDLYG